MELMEDASNVERMMMKKAIENGVPINGSIELLPLCNMNCDMCYVRLSKEEMDRQGRMHSADEWIEIGKQMQKSGVLFLLLTGGEPLLFPDFKRLYLELRKLGMMITINTNGTLIDEEWALFFSKHKPRRINITLYGSDNNAYHHLCHYDGGFDKVIQGIRHLKKYDIDVKIAGSITKANEQDVKQLIDIGNELDCPVRCDTYMMPATREREKPYHMQSRLHPKNAAKARVLALKNEIGKDLFTQYVNQVLLEIENFVPNDGIHHMTCYAGRCSFTVNWQGEMRPCVILSKPAMSVFEEGFQKSWEYIMKETKKIILSSQCLKCSLRPLCRTCAASALLESGAYDGIPTYMCEYAQYTLDYLKEELNKI